MAVPSPSQADAGWWIRQIAGATLLPLVILWGTTYWGSAFFWQLQSRRELRAMATLGVRRFEQIVEQSEEVALQALDDPDFINAVQNGERRHIEQRLHDLLSTHADVERVSVLDAERRVWLSVPPVEEVPEESEETAAPRAIGIGQDAQWPLVSRFSSTRGARRRDMIGVAVPILTEQGLLGLLQLQYHAEQLEAWIAQVRSSEVGGFLYVVDQDGYIVVHPYRIISGQPINVGSRLPIPQSILPEGQVSAFRDEGGHWNLAAITMTSFGWRVIAQQSFKRMQAQARRTYFPVMVISSLVVALASLLGLWRGATVPRAAHPGGFQRRRR